MYVKGGEEDYLFCDQTDGMYAIKGKGLLHTCTSKEEAVRTCMAYLDRR